MIKPKYKDPIIFTKDLKDPKKGKNFGLTYAEKGDTGRILLTEADYPEYWVCRSGWPIIFKATHKKEFEINDQS